MKIDIKNKKLIIHACILSTFILYFIFAETIFNSIIKVEEEATLQRNIDLIEETNNVRYSIDAVRQTNRRGKDLIELSGWAFSAGQDTHNSRIYILLESKTNQYIFNAFPRKKPDVTAYFRGEYNFNLDDSGFYTLIPQFKIKDGVYNIGLYIEKDNEKYLMYTDTYLTKAKRGVIPNAISEKKDFTLIEKKELFKYNIESIEKEHIQDIDLLYIKGWAFIEEEYEVGDNIYIVLKSNDNILIFDAYRMARRDVGTHFDDSSLDNAGFYAYIPKEFVQEEKYEIGISIEKNGNRILQFTGEYFGK
ncbi:hypothetical protein SAMN05660297_01706 [Natronincola peptidivorans]|uniref:Uncharacterized protein n=1 Tax=Natronincola peptidivorans TaxID=426128 RepID=A0A1I0CPZ7_9FIRM|nr:hypothetical protein [Natronincola peptidivorans]SET21730.1 hypothetical protein SAMN05660297_01706 [Natronincola peptidivorans]